MAANARKLIAAYQSALAARGEYATDWEEAEKFCLPHKRRTGVLHSTHGYRSARNLAAGLFSNTYMPGRPWLALAASDGADDVDSIKMWLQRLAEKILFMFSTSNFSAEYYQALLDAGVVGNGILFTGWNADGLFFRAYRAQDVAYSFTDGKLDAIYREFKLTPRQAMAEFPDMPQDLRVAQEFVRDPLSVEKFRFLHCVYGRTDRDTTRRDGENAAFASVYICLDGDRIVKESGYATMPYAVLRFYRTDSDYGSGPGVAALPDLRLLSSMSGDFLSALEMSICPPVFLPGIAGEHKISMKPGAVNWMGSLGNEGRPVFALPNIDLASVSAEKQTIKSQIDDEFFTSVLYQLAAMAAANNNSPMTAREIEERSDEKVLVLAPVVSRLFAEFLNQVVTRVIEIALEHQQVQAPPPDIAAFGPGLPASVKYLSRLDARINELMTRNVMAAGQAIGQLKQMEMAVPEMGDLMDVNKASREIVYALNVPADIIRPEKEASERAMARAQAQAQAAQQQAAMSMMKPVDTQKASEPGSPAEAMAKQQGVV